MASTYLSLYFHLVFATKNREDLLDSAWRNLLHRYLYGAVVGLGAVPIEIGGTEDHVHMLVSLKSTHVLADVVREVKKSSSKWVAERVAGFGWQDGYGAFSVSHSHVDSVAAYIRGQEEHHRVRSSAEELRSILSECGVSIDERFFE